jgi:uncharacterized Zn finger protein
MSRPNSSPLGLRPDYGTSDAALPRGDEEIERVASRFLQADVGGSLEAVQRYVGVLNTHKKATHDLVRAAEARRVSRAGQRTVTLLVTDEAHVAASVEGSAGTYATRITFAPRRGHFCTCPDWARNGRTVGPCKHVLALGDEWSTRVQQELDRIDDAVVSILERGIL